ncbi:MAG: 16S rRNA (cytosine(1402)-N(4))-methyltransferase RsmH [Clostridia bacterium]|nr:16S rRNA (cytosine(1402)-N(4))-methyltransferase RsmH [Clostridia bacterium]
MEFSHVPVLFRETIDSLEIVPDGVYADCTAGGGGHSAAIAEKLTTGRLYSIDRDPDAIEALTERFRDKPNVTVVHENFLKIAEIREQYAPEGFNGVLADLGVSSHQLDTPERGFSFHTDAPLDMRMSREGKSAYDVVNTYSEADLRRILYAYGEEKCAPSVARRIAAERSKRPIGTTLELAEIVKSAIPAKMRRDGHPARRTFQAIRIEVNGELDYLDEAVNAMFRSLKVGGVLSVITFHSLEDRIVKNAFRALTQGCTCPPYFPVCTCGKTPAGELTNRGVAPGEAELAENPRSRSARLRSIRKLKEPDNASV